jgi:hypothetical protein
MGVEYRLDAAVVGHHSLRPDQDDPNHVAAALSKPGAPADTAVV